MTCKMAKGLYYYLRQAWKKPRQLELWRDRLIEWRRGETIVKLEKPTRLDRARSLGWKAKRGFVVVRVRVRRGGRKRPRPARKGRRPKRQGIRKVLKMNYQWVAEQRAARKFRNLEVLNSYWIAKDGKYYWYEVLLANPFEPQISSDKKLSWIVGKRNRAFRGLTSSARKSRGLRRKGRARGTEKLRPSLRVHSRRGK